MTVRLATEADIDPAVDVMATAFQDYAFTRHTVGSEHDGPADHLDRLRRLYRIFIEHVGLRHGRVWVTDDVTAVAAWTTPDTPGTVFAEVADDLTEIAGDRAAISAECEAVMGEHRPDRPAWFLGAIAVAPGRQGRGLGGAVIAPGIAAASAARVPAFLETSAASNARWYAGLGFRTVAEYDLPHGGPHTWAMQRG
ncbi:hypothetical protein FB566_1287 [Stackebrandtia endophytica]|uniref:N-acetyltransferase domain-containing protein n=1 Tax=Stackebrandtia endophytica TaxID=1496996 RepID=A0A543AT77_9ACTN|nr:GNAT family N-acetyltransferase [Stackebrandtia endophytica]TQL75773.1 hypothetical protein FB566_1287 [Stackebrandtia endophytica]